MRCLVLLVLLAVSRPEPPEVTFAFQGKAKGVLVAGYLVRDVANVARGGLWLSGAVHARFRLAGLDQGSWHGWFADQEHYLRTLVYAPEDPWLVGVIYWRGDAGALDVFSMDQERGELPLHVRVSSSP